MNQSFFFKYTIDRTWIQNRHKWLHWFDHIPVY